MKLLNFTHQMSTFFFKLATGRYSTIEQNSTILYNLVQSCTILPGVLLKKSGRKIDHEAFGTAKILQKFVDGTNLFRFVHQTPTFDSGSLLADK